MKHGHTHKEYKRLCKTADGSERVTGSCCEAGCVWLDEHLTSGCVAGPNLSEETSTFPAEPRTKLVERCKIVHKEYHKTIVCPLTRRTRVCVALDAHGWNVQAAADDLGMDVEDVRVPHRLRNWPNDLPRFADFEAVQVSNAVLRRLGEDVPSNAGAGPDPAEIDRWIQVKLRDMERRMDENLDLLVKRAEFVRSVVVGARFVDRHGNQKRKYIDETESEKRTRIENEYGPEFVDSFASTPFHMFGVDYEKKRVHPKPELVRTLRGVSGLTTDANVS